MGRGLSCVGITDGCGVFCLIVTSSTTLSSVTASSSHSLHVFSNASFFCVFDGGGGAEVGFWAAEGGEGTWALPTLLGLLLTASPSTSVVVVGKREREGKRVKEVGREL